MSVNDRREYKHSERESILNYIINSERYNEVKGRALWQDMENDGVCTRSWQSMKEHFRRKIVYMLEAFNITENERVNLLIGAGHRYKKKRKPAEVDDYFIRDFSSSEDESDKLKKQSKDSDDDDVIICENLTSSKFRKPNPDDVCEVVINEIDSSNVDVNIKDSNKNISDKSDVKEDSVEECIINESDIKQSNSVDCVVDESDANFDYSNTDMSKIKGINEEINMRSESEESTRSTNETRKREEIVNYLQEDEEILLLQFLREHRKYVTKENIDNIIVLFIKTYKRELDCKKLEANFINVVVPNLMKKNLITDDEIEKFHEWFKEKNDFEVRKTKDVIIVTDDDSNSRFSEIETQSMDFLSDETFDKNYESSQQNNSIRKTRSYDEMANDNTKGIEKSSEIKKSTDQNRRKPEKRRNSHSRSENHNQQIENVPQHENSKRPRNSHQSEKTKSHQTNYQYETRNKSKKPPENRSQSKTRNQTKNQEPKNQKTKTHKIFKTRESSRDSIYHKTYKITETTSESGEQLSKYRKIIINKSPIHQTNCNIPTTQDCTQSDNRQPPISNEPENRNESDKPHSKNESENHNQSKTHKIPETCNKSETHPEIQQKENTIIQNIPKIENRTQNESQSENNDPPPTVSDSSTKIINIYTKEDETRIRIRINNVESIFDTKESEQSSDNINVISLGEYIHLLTLKKIHEKVTEDISNFVLEKCNPTHENQTLDKTAPNFMEDSINYCCNIMKEILSKISSDSMSKILETKSTEKSNERTSDVEIIGCSTPVNTEKNLSNITTSDTFQSERIFLIQNDLTQNTDTIRTDMLRIDPDSIRTEPESIQPDEVECDTPKDSLFTSTPVSGRTDFVTIRPDPITIVLDPVMKSDPITVHPNPITISTDPVNIQSDPIINRSDSVTIHSDPIRLDPLTIRSKPVTIKPNPLRSELINVKSDIKGLPVLIKRTPLKIKLTPLRVQSDVSKIHPDTNCLRVRSDLDSVKIPDGNPVVIRPDPDANPSENQENIQDVVTIRTDPDAVTIRSDLDAVTIRTDPDAVTIRTDPDDVTIQTDPDAVTIRTDPDEEPVNIRDDRDVESVTIHLDPFSILSESEMVVSESDSSNIETNQRRLRPVTLPNLDLDIQLNRSGKRTYEVMSKMKRKGPLNVRSCEQINLLVENLNRPEGQVRVKPLSKLCRKVQNDDPIVITDDASTDLPKLDLRVDQIKTEPESPPSTDNDEVYFEILDNYNNVVRDREEQIVDHNSDEDCVIVEGPEIEISTTSQLLNAPNGSERLRIEHNYHIDQNL